MIPTRHQCRRTMLDALVTCPSRDPLPLTLFNERSQKFSEHRYRYDKESLDSRYWCKAIDLAEAIDIPDFLPALATFVREQRKLTDGLLSSNYEVDRRGEESEMGGRVVREYIWLADMLDA